MGRLVNCPRQRAYSDSFVLTPEDLNMPYEEVQFFTEDGVSLTGWFIPQSSGGRPSRRVVVCCHPYNSNKSNLLGLARSRPTAAVPAGNPHCSCKLTRQHDGQGTLGRKVFGLHVR